MSNRLLAIVEVSPEARIACQANGCGHAVYKRIHVVSINGSLQVLGSECFKRLFGGAIGGNPAYSSSDGRRLTDAERRMLQENTAQLVAQLEAEHEAAQDPAREKLQRISQSGIAREASGGPPHRFRAPLPVRQPAAPRRHLGPTPEAIRKYEAQAKIDVRAKFDVDPNLPGWRGLVLQRITELSKSDEVPD
ncbi:hypothetical protein [Variovorax sp. JS1663]|uniref:hypothetical protein n=1 Tax=Variovorax sp. JS1663 TaxID=1851577 RepID=UPI000B34969F|nr:hypothetical protein [Variovorax sp. JS1663]